MMAQFMRKVLAEDNKGYAKIMYSRRDDLLYANYYSNDNKMYHTEEFPKMTADQVELHAFDWCS